MNENLNLIEILKDCPNGTKLYSPALGEVDFAAINNDRTYPIIVKTEDGTFCFTQQGKFYDIKQSECLLFPSRDQQDWSKFKPKQIKKATFDPKTLKPFDKVLVKKGTESYYAWYPDFICLPPTDVDDTIYCIGTNDVAMAIPFNDDTKHLINTNEEAPDLYKY